MNIECIDQLVVGVDYYQVGDFVGFYQLCCFGGELVGFDGMWVVGYYIGDVCVVYVQCVVQCVVQVVVGEQFDQVFIGIDYGGYVQLFVVYFYQCFVEVGVGVYVGQFVVVVYDVGDVQQQVLFEVVGWV